MESFIKMSPWPAIVVSDLSSMVIFLWQEHDMYDIKNLEVYVMWSVAPKSTTQEHGEFFLR